MQGLFPLPSVTFLLRAVAGVGLLALAVVAAAHPNVDEHLALVEAELRRNPADPALYLKRGDLHRRQRRWQAAIADYQHAEDLDPKLSFATRLRAAVLLESDRPEDAVRVLHSFLEQHPRDAKAFLVRGRALARLGRAGAAARDLGRAIEILPAPRPDHYREHAEALTQAGADADALRTLEDGVHRLGPLPALLRHAIDIDLRYKRYDAALARIDEATAHSSAPVAWLLRRAEILESAGRPAQALTAYRQAQDLLAPVPGARRDVKAIADLRARVQTGLERARASSENAGR